MLRSPGAVLSVLAALGFAAPGVAQTSQSLTLDLTIDATILSISATNTTVNFTATSMGTMTAGTASTFSHSGNVPYSIQLSVPDPCVYDLGDPGQDCSLDLTNFQVSIDGWTSWWGLDEAPFWLLTGISAGDHPDDFTMQYRATPVSYRNTTYRVTFDVSVYAD